MSANPYFVLNIDRLIQRFKKLDETFPFSLGAVYGVFKQDPLRLGISDLQPGRILETNMYPPYFRGAFLNRTIHFPNSNPDKVSPTSINREWNRIEAFYPFFTVENRSITNSAPITINANIDKRVNIQGIGSQVAYFNSGNNDDIHISTTTNNVAENEYANYVKKCEDYNNQYSELAKESLNLIFGSIANAREKLRLPSSLNDPSTIWGIFLYQLAWNRFPHTGIAVEDPTGENELFCTLWPTNGVEALPLNVKTILNQQKLYLPEYYQGIIWVIASIEYCDIIENCNIVDYFQFMPKESVTSGEKNTRYRITFSPPLVLYQLYDGSDDMTMDQAFFTFAWSGEGTDPSMVKLERMENSPSDGPVFEIIGARLYTEEAIDSEESCIRLLRDCPRFEAEVSFKGKGQVIEVCRFAHDKTRVTTKLFEDVETTIRLFFCWNDRRRTFPDDLAGVKVRLFVKPKVIDSKNQGDDFKAVFYDSKKRPQSWLNSIRTIHTEPLSIKKAEKILEAIRHGEDYNYCTDNHGSLYPQNRISNIVSELNDLTGTSIKALEFLRTVEMDVVLGQIQPLVDRLPEKYRSLAAFYQRQEGENRCEKSEVSLSQTTIYSSSAVNGQQTKNTSVYPEKPHGAPDATSKIEAKQESSPLNQVNNNPIVPINIDFNELLERVRQLPPPQCSKKGDDVWVSAKEVAKKFAIKTDTLKSYRSKGTKSDDGLSGVDVHGRAWRKINAKSHVFYYRPSVNMALADSDDLSKP